VIVYIMKLQGGGNIF